MQTVIEVAERQGTARATGCLVFAALNLGTLLASFGPDGADFIRGMWTGLSATTLLVMLPIHGWLRPSSPIARLLNDETVREHRRMSMTAAFWATMASALALAIAVMEGAAVSAFDTARVIATAALTAALISFATLELRAARG